jgi:hypothetical protein
MPRALRVAFAVGIGLFLTVMSVLAHHIVPIYDNNKKISLDGVIKAIHWTNPHIWYEIEVTDGAGKKTMWNYTVGEPNPLHRRGYVKEDLKVGARIVLQNVNPAADGSNWVAGGTVAGNGGPQIFNGNGSHGYAAKSNAAPPTDPKIVANPRDFSGLWGQGTGNTDLTQSLLPGEEIVLTAYGAERYKKVDLKNAPVNKCLPYGPNRAGISIAPSMFVQSSIALVMLYEPQIDYRVIYLDGRSNPSDAAQFPTWFGHSTGKWDGDTLVVETVGIDDRTWLDSYGLEHSKDMKMTERFKKTDPNTISVTTTIDDPVFYAKPWTYSYTKRRGEDPEVALGNSGPIIYLMPTYCEEYPVMEHALSTPARHKNPPKMPNAN